MNLPLLTSRSRVMLFAPHPDDESLATGVYLQRAVACGAVVRVVYATDGERNCWPQRVLEHKVRIREMDRRRELLTGRARLRITGYDADRRRRTRGRRRVVTSSDEQRQRAGGRNGPNRI